MAAFNVLTQREIRDNITGEVISMETSKTIRTKVKSDSFYITFIKFIAPFYSLKSETAQRLLVWMCEHAEFNTGKVYMPTDIRKDISLVLNISNNAITNNLKKLKDAKLISGANGVFNINPKIFWKGDLKVREKLLEEKNIKLDFAIED